MNTIKIICIGVFFFGLQASFAQQGPYGPRGGQERGKGPIERMQEVLDLDPEQLSALQALIQEQQENRKQQQERMRENRSQQQEQFQASIQEVLTEEQWSTWQAYRQGQQDTRQQQRKRMQKRRGKPNNG
ncbi:MAG: hypothetical protein ACXIT9_06655 [Nitritalea sp.]